MNEPVSLLVVLLSVLAGNVGAAPAGAEAENLTAWEWYQNVTWENAKASRWIDLLLPPTVFDKAQADLSDLRLYDSKGQAVPYALRVRRAKDEQSPLKTREFNRVTRPDRTAELSLDLAEKPEEHNELRVLMPGANVRRLLRLEGSNDDRNWSTLLDKVEWMAFQAGNQKINIHDFHYPFSRFRYLRVQVSPDRSRDDDKPVLQSVSVLRSIRVPGEYITLPATREPREPVPAQGAPGSAWIIDFGARVPCEKLSFDVRNEEFVRRYLVQQIYPDDRPSSAYLAHGEWSRRRGEKPGPLTISFDEILARRVRLLVTDHRNEPLSIEAVRYTSPARQVIFAPPADLALPLRLYFGNPSAPAPHYDFAAALPEVLAPAPQRAGLEELTKNPRYQPPLLPWSERWPWLIYVVLSAASLVLTALLFLLGREAIARHDRLSAMSGR